MAWQELIGASRNSLKAVFFISILAVLQGCGGGGGGGAPGDNNPPSPGPPTQAQLNSASRLAAQATFGLAYEDIEQIARQGNVEWLEAQFSLPIAFHQPVVDQLLARQAAGDFAQIETEIGNFEFLFRRLAWWQQTINSEDVLRQRIAYSLSQIFVVSDTVDALIIDPYALSNYYDTLLTHAFGNFRELLRAVALHPAMGIYLSHVNNRKADPANNTFPDENFAREVMQLFSIGLFEINPDGSLRLDNTGAPIATYSNVEIREFAKIFTGLSYGGAGAFFGRRLPNFVLPMRMFDAFHEPGEKRLLNGLVVPAGQSGEADIEAAIDNLFNHPNVGPFIGKQLIQRLVTSNPSPAYIERVAEAFAGTDTGVRGDLKAVLRAVLLDPEATAASDDSSAIAKLREPLLRYTSLLRQFNVSSPDGFFANLGFLAQQLLRQHPLSAPSVFNFYLPSHTPPGDLAAAGLVAPEFQITNSGTVVAISNLADLVVLLETANDFAEPPFMQATLDLAGYQALAEDPDALLDRLDTLMTFGTLSEGNRRVISDVLALTEDLDFRVKTAIYLIFTSPDYAVQL